MTTSSDLSAIAVHGGAFDIAATDRDRFRDGCLSAARAGWQVLDDGGSALDAVEGAVRVLEASGIFGAGRGSALNEDGVIELDAGMMDGAALHVGSVVAVRGVPHPITLARRVLESQFAVFAGAGARQFAERAGVETCDPGDLVSEREREMWEERRVQPDANWVDTMFGRDTVGAIVLDRAGNLAAGTSTGGMPFKPAGRVGDSPFIGAGLYADNATGAVSTTGHGERIIPIVMAKTAADLMGGGLEPQLAADRALATLARLDGRGGLITMDRRGRVGIAWNTPAMAFALRPSGNEDYRAGP
ncbi:MAG: isoaspartyl peptidase/L-asparaginase family protein [Chloroflexota bacterium]